MKTLVACRSCGLVQQATALTPGVSMLCFRCRSIIRTYAVSSLEHTAAFTLAALILYIPANIYPILRMNFYGAYSESTVWDGCVSLFRQGQWPVAAVVFLASIVIPLCKLIGLLYLVATTKYGSTRLQQQRTWIYKIIDQVGPWAMLDVFLLAILVALVKLRELATVLPGPGLVAFTAMVVLTILASNSFDSRWIWNESDHRQ